MSGHARFSRAQVAAMTHSSLPLQREVERLRREVAELRKEKEGRTAAFDECMKDIKGKK